MTDSEPKLLSGPSDLEGWKVAVRPHTLPASVAPVLVGTGLALHYGIFHLPSALMALLGAVLLQVAINLANDYFDYEKGVDTEDRIGFPRACNQGLLEPHQVKNGILLTMIACLLPGGYLVAKGGIPLLVVGILSLLAVLGYSGGPLPYGSYALGDFMVFLFFGIVAVTGTYYVQFCATANVVFPGWFPPGSLPWVALVTSLPSGALATGILVINNLRDRQQDQEAGKQTLAVVLGREGSLQEFRILFVVAYGVPFVFPLFGFSLLSWLPLITLPLAIRILKSLSAHPAPEMMNERLTETGQLLFLHNLLFALGLAF